MGRRSRPMDLIMKKDKCTNPEKKDCNEEATRTHLLVEKNWDESEYPMCDECYESWCYD